MAEKKNRQTGAKSIRRTIDILRLISSANESGIRLSDVARQLEIPAPTVHRILAVLLEEKFVSYDMTTKLYHLGADIYAMGAVTQQFSIRDRYHTALNRICEQTEDATYLIIHSGNDGVCIDRVLGKFRVQVLGYEIGERRVLGVGAAGQALISFLPEKQQERILKANAPRYLKYYGIEVDEIRTRIRQTRKLHYAVSIHKVSSDSVGVGVPILNDAGHVVAAISVAGITNRMDSDRCRWIADLIRSEISAVAPPPN